MLNTNQEPRKIIPGFPSYEASGLGRIRRGSNTMYDVVCKRTWKYV